MRRRASKVEPHRKHRFKVVGTDRNTQLHEKSLSTEADSRRMPCYHRRAGISNCADVIEHMETESNPADGLAVIQIEIEFSNFRLAEAVLDRGIRIGAVYRGILNLDIGQAHAGSEPESGIEAQGNARIEGIPFPIDAGRICGHCCRLPSLVVSKVTQSKAEAIGPDLCTLESK